MCFDPCPSQWYYFRVKESFIDFLVPILGHPVYQFLHKPDFSDFTVSGSGLAMGHRFRKYIYHFAGRIRILWPMLREAMTERKDQN